ncbi:Hypothetical protein FKW44_016748 [Caligus rogercresseyi]|uniref:Uncharacterized protein n=1 Tax=Caligus rogercresseyi TaxID=217165 RepID=A0A7T8H2E4_CALRO|nr:Hypothetical protein FKW44_016748 [Caligus rogercresseyi]
MFVQLCRFCLFHPSAFCVDDALEPGAEGGVGLGHQALSNFLACFIMELTRAALVL